ncbi:NAD(P)-dependent oxidoreductase [Aquimarina sp. I32.4]|uniref:NAD(P)-dependent oxidoreductase n=1 Tax=Aquimarina sp. I32.4 TaxID=2053903 RepID=UPI000CDEF25C|nr:NAD(P)-binding oxidoreductase [Aquimarina sp. I32.4]
MKVLVFGATGTIGKHLLEQLLQSGYAVTAFCRNASKLSQFAHGNLTIAEGDVLQLDTINKAMTDQDVVIIALGSGKSRKSIVRSEGTKNIITAMKNNNIRRLICQTTLGAGDSNGNLNFFWKHIMFGWFLKGVFLDHELQEQYVKNSRLDWTIVRPGSFTDGKKTGRYLHGFEPNDTSITLKISRADVADFIIKQIKDQTYLYQTPGLSY